MPPRVGSRRQWIALWCRSRSVENSPRLCQRFQRSRAQSGSGKTQLRSGTGRRRGNGETCERGHGPTSRSARTNEKVLGIMLGPGITARHVAFALFYSPPRRGRARVGVHRNMNSAMRMRNQSLAWAANSAEFSLVICRRKPLGSLKYVPSCSGRRPSRSPWSSRSSIPAACSLSTIA